MSPGGTPEDGGLCEQYKAAARAVFDVWSRGELERLDELVAPDVVHHDPYDPNAAEGLVGMKRTIQANRSAFPDMRLTVEDQVAEGDKVVTRWRGEMTHSGDLAGAAATGRRVTITGITIDRFEDGKIVEAWRSMDTLGLLRGVGALGDARLSPERFDLDDDEVTVLNHVMHALTERTDFEQLVPDAADRQAMHNLLAALEREDRAVFSDAYDHCVEQARRRLLPHK